MSLSKQEILAEIEGVDSLSDEDKEIVFAGNYAYNYAQNLLDPTANEWKLGKHDANKGIKTTFVQKDIGKIFKVDADIDAPLSKVVEILKDIDHVGEWSSSFGVVQNVKQVKDIQVQYSATKGTIAGVISQRDMVFAQKVEENETSYSEFTKSVKVADKPDVKKIVRGEIRVSCIKVTQIDDNKCHYTAMLSADFKGWIPQKVVDLAMNTSMFDEVNDLRKAVTTR